MTEVTAAQNLLSAYVLLNAARQNLNMVWEFKKDIKNQQFIDAVKQLKPTANYFCKIIEQTLIPAIPTAQMQAIEEQAFKVLEELDEVIKHVK
jgi:inorganic triphosphatase YgiF